MMKFKSIFGASRLVSAGLAMGLLLSSSPFAIARKGAPNQFIGKNATMTDHGTVKKLEQLQLELFAGGPSYVAAHIAQGMPLIPGTVASGIFASGDLKAFSYFLVRKHEYAPPWNKRAMKNEFLLKASSEKALKQILARNKFPTAEEHAKLFTGPRIQIEQKDHGRGFSLHRAIPVHVDDTDSIEQLVPGTLVNLDDQ